MGLAALAVLGFLPSLWAGLIADDYALLRTIGRFDGFGWAFTHNDLGQPGSAGHFYRPVWVLWNVGVDRIFGGSATSLHAANLVLFAAIVVEVWLLARRLLDAARAWVAAAAFAVYPRHAESVAWISGSTDLVAAVLALAALLPLVGPARVVWRTVLAGVFAAAAALAKESAFVLPLLAALVLLARGRRRADVAPLAAIVAAQAAVLAARTVVLDGIGGYSAYPWTVERVAAVAATDVAAALSVPQLELLRHAWLLVVPAACAALAAWGAWRLRRCGEHRRLAIAGLGVAWFGVALLPSLNLAVDLNNANGERLLFLASVGLALVFAALVPVRAALAAAAAGALALCLVAAYTWVVGGRIADRIVADALALGPERGTLVLLSVPEAYRYAHVFHGSLDAAVAYEGRPGLGIVLCLPVQVLDEARNTVSFARDADGSYRGTTAWSAPFDFPVLRGSTASISPRCRYARADAKRWPVGVGLVGRAFLDRPAGRVRLAFFDGYGLRPYPS